MIFLPTKWERLVEGYRKRPMVGILGTIFQMAISIQQVSGMIGGCWNKRKTNIIN